MIELTALASPRCSGAMIPERKESPIGADMFMSAARTRYRPPARTAFVVKARLSMNAVDRPCAMTIAREGTVPLRERRAADRRDPDRHVREGEERAAPRILDGELEQHPRRHERDEEPGSQADESVDAGELQERSPVHRLRPRLARPHGFPIAAQQD